METASINLRWRYPRFFTTVDQAAENVYINGDDAKHIITVLRMRVGEKAILCDDGIDYFSEITQINKNEVAFKIIDSKKNDAEPSIYLHLYQCMPKSDKMEFIVQKATELGVSEITPIISRRCVSKPDEKSCNKKIERYQKITLEAAKQCGRGKIPHVNNFTTFNECLNQLKNDDLGIIFYECGGEKINKIIEAKAFNTVNIIIGSEGGFDGDEIEAAIKKGYKAATLGTRILRAETAPITAISILMNLTGNI